MASRQVIELRVAWWFKYYMIGVWFFACMFETSPDVERMEMWLHRAIRMRVING